MTSGLSRIERYWAPRQQLAEAMGKRWFETIVPFCLLIFLIVVFWIALPGFMTVGNIASMSRDFAEFGFVALAIAIVLIGGGIDLSTGSIFALANFTALYVLYALGWPAWSSIVIVPLVGALLGAINGFLIGFLRSRALLTTMASLIIFRAIYDLLIYQYATDISTGFVDSGLWDMLGAGSLLGIPTNMVALIMVAVVLHMVLSRSRYGWHIAAVGAGRLAARHAGLPVRWLVFSTYVLSGILSSVAGLFYASRFLSAGRDAGLGLEIDALTAVVLGGISLMGGRGSVGRAMIGAAAIFILNNGLVRAGVVSGMNSFLIGLLMLAAVAIDVKLLKNLQRIASRIFLDPARVDLGPLEPLDPGSTSKFALNYDLRGAYPIGFKGEDFAGQEDYVLDDREMRVFNPEDILVDAEGRVYTGTSGGLIIRYYGHNFGDREIFARTGGYVRGMAFRKDGTLLALAAGIGLLSIDRQGAIVKLSDETNRTPLRLRDDSRFTTPSNLTIAPDGKVYFTEGSYRYDMNNWINDALESRPNGRILVYDPDNGRTRTLVARLVYPSGICMAPDGRSFVFAETWLCRISRYWLKGPKRGRIETVINNLPVYPANITASEDGGYWVAIVAARTPGSDLVTSEKKFRYRMIRRLPRDEWLVPNFNVGGAFHISETGEVGRVLWEPPGRGQNYSAVTSARQYGPYLYIAGIFNNRIGRIVIDPDGPVWRSPNFYYPGELDRLEGREAAE